MSGWRRRLGGGGVGFRGAQVRRDEDEEQRGSRLIWDCEIVGVVWLER
jgi:hypothetical protein